MAKSKRGEVKAKKPELGYGEQHEAFMRPGETLKSNQVFSNIVAAQRALGDRFNLEEIIDQVGLDDVDEKEGAYLQKRLRVERGIEFPENLRFDESVLGDTKADPIVKDKPQVVNPGAAAEVVAREHAELVKDIFDTLKLDFDRAKKDLAGFSIETEIGKYKEILGDDGVKQVLEQLAQAGVTDLKEGGEEVKGEIHGRPPEAEQTRTGKLLFVRLEYKNDQLYVVRRSEKTGKEIKPSVCRNRKFILPKGFKEVAKNENKLSQALKELGRLYVYSVKPWPRSWRDTGNIDFFEVFFPGTQEGIRLPQNDTIMDEVNEIARRRKKRIQAGEIIGYNEEGYQDAPGFTMWRDKQEEIIAEKYIREKKEKIMKDLGVDLDAPEPAQPVELESSDVLPDPAGVMDDEILTPAEVGMSDEKADKLKAAIEKLLVDSYAKKIREKHPLEDFPRMTDARVRAVAEGYVTDADVEDLFQAKLRQIKDKQARTS